MKYSLLSHLCNYKKNKGPNTETFGRLVNIDHLAMLVGVSFEESFAAILEAYLIYQYISFCR